MLVLAVVVERVTLYYSGIEVPGPESSNAACSTCTARGTSERSITQEILIGEVAIISMFTPSSASVEKTRAATPGCERMPAPMIETLPISSCVGHVRERLPRERLERRARDAQVLARDGEGDLREPAGGGGLVLDDHVDVHVRPGERLEDARGGAELVGDADERDARLVGRVGDGCDQGLLHRAFFEHNRTGLGIEGGAAVDAHAVIARVLDRAQLQHARAGGGHLEHLLEGDGRELARVGHDPRIGGEDAGDVGVDLALLRAERGGDRDGGRVRAAAPERGDVLGGGRDALKAGDEHDRVLVERRPHAVGPHVEDPRLRMRIVGHDPRLGARQRDRAVAEVVDRDRAERTGDALAGGQQHVHLARVRDRRRAPRAIAISSSVVFPRAESTATTL